MKILRNLALLTFLSAALPMAAQPVTPVLESAEVSGIAADGTGIVFIRLDVPDGTYLGRGPEFFRLELDGPRGIEYGPLATPEGDAYRGRVVFEMPFRLKNRRPAESLELTVRIQYSLCEDSGLCRFPETEEYELKWSP